MFHIVQDEQSAGQPRQCLHRLFQRVSIARLGQPQGAADRIGNAAGIAQVRERHKCYGAAKRRGGIAGHFHSQPGLPRPARPSERQQAVAGQQADDLCTFPLSPEEAGPLERQPGSGHVGGDGAGGTLPCYRRFPGVFCEIALCEGGLGTLVELREAFALGQRPVVVEAGQQVAAVSLYRTPEPGPPVRPRGRYGGRLESRREDAGIGENGDGVQVDMKRVGVQDAAKWDAGQL